MEAEAEGEGEGQSEGAVDGWIDWIAGIDVYGWMDGWIPVRCLVCDGNCSGMGSR